MAYDIEEIKEKALKAIAKYKLVFDYEVFSYLPCGKTWFYNNKLNEMDELKEALENNRIAKKAKLRNKWEDSSNPALNLALYRLLSTPEEHKKLNPSTQDEEQQHNHKGDINITFTGKSNLPTSEDDIEDFTVNED